MCASFEQKSAIRADRLGEEHLVERRDRAGRTPGTSSSAAVKFPKGYRLWMKTPRAIFVALAAMLAAASMRAAPDSAKSRCAAPEYRQFDFWAGDWDAYDADDMSRPAARVHVDPILDGCALREDYRGTSGLVGQSLNIYDAVRKVWHQSWVTNRGQLLVLEGELRDGTMELRATEPTANGPVLWKAEWIPASDGGVRETARTSSDGGKTWKPAFDMIFRKRK
jgi:hypothetical protein